MRQERQHADATHDAGFADLETDPVVAPISVAAYPDNAREPHAGIVLDTHRSPPVALTSGPTISGRRDLGEFAGLAGPTLASA